MILGRWCMSLNNNNEIWKDIFGYEGYYKVSNFGNIKSCERTINHGLNNAIRFIKGQVIKPFNDNHGYHMVSLSKNGKVKKYKVHRLVAEAFIPNPKNKPTINHKNEIRHDNHVCNLEWATYQENNNYGGHNERVSKTLSKQIEQLDKNNNLISTFESARAASLATGVTLANIKSCLNHANRVFAGGYKWRYVI